MIRSALSLIPVTMPLFCAAPGSAGKDLDFRTRKVDQTDNENDSGPGDLGAYERQLSGAVADTLFLDGFELPL